jgi:signal transduction histidine kinase
MLVALDDGTWLVFGLPERGWGIVHWYHNSLIVGFVLLSTFAIALLAARTLVRPIVAFADAARRFGTDPRASPMIEQGPAELRNAAAAFNAMQTQIRRFVTDRTDMLAAISHDLRTPLTRMRLRGEFIDDREQQRRLFRDVDEMQAMIDAALAFFRDDAIEEQSTSFDFSELVRLVVDDLTDQGRTIIFEGADHVVYYGRPSALKRAIANLIENACTYATNATAEVNFTHTGPVLSVRDDGPGIPEPLLEAVFSPFYRVDPSRNRQTGGVGLGLTSARTIVRAHGGEITLRNQQDGGLLVMMTLPLTADFPGPVDLARPSGSDRPD